MKPGTRADHYRNEPRLITRSTILILSGWCLGLSSAEFVASFHVPVFWSGVGGLTAFIGLEYCAWRRKRMSATASLQETVHKLKRQRTLAALPEGMSSTRQRAG